MLYIWKLADGCEPKTLKRNGNPYPGMGITTLPNTVQKRPPQNGERACANCERILQPLSNNGLQMALPLLICPYDELWEEPGIFGRGFFTVPCGYVE